jgi:hypothetical protein
MTQGDPRQEYLDASNNVRHWSTLRFAQLTIYVALTAGLLNVLFIRGAGSPRTSLAIELAGLVVTAVYWLLQERTMHYWYAFVRRAAELEPALGYTQYSHRPRAGVVSSANAVRVLFAVMLLFWGASAVNLV